MNLRQTLPVSALAVAGIFGLAACSGGISDADPNVESLEETAEATPSPTEEATEPFPSPESSPSSMSPESSADASSLNATCESYWEFDQEFAPGIENVMMTAMDPNASDEERTEAHDEMVRAREEFNQILADAEDQEFIDLAEDTVPTFDLFVSVTDPDLSEDEKNELVESSDIDSAIEAEEELIDLCNAELN